MDRNPLAGMAVAGLLAQAQCSILGAEGGSPLVTGEDLVDRVEHVPHRQKFVYALV
ncbi:hypothetical protein [Nocardia suismassiliense]|uniref:hypothetical protein n=1 Tax=Nocardia suismassiliense TaxID=2077092 RepID=UPI00131F24CB|nr:hypothetical protein [Nocardia suismassiliense]